MFMVSGRRSSDGGGGWAGVGFATIRGSGGRIDVGEIGVEKWVFFHVSGSRRGRVGGSRSDRDEEERRSSGERRRGGGRGEPSSRDAASAVSAEEQFQDGTRDADTMLRMIMGANTLLY
jgi:hypothetical protein